jgi:cobalamin biosynthesis protein CobT
MRPNLFYAIMEAEGDLLEPFDPANEPTPEPEPDMQQQGQTDEQPPADMGADSPPEATDMEDLSFDETGGDAGAEDATDQDQNENGDQKKESLSDKANDILNQRLYQQMLDRNSEIEEVIENLQAIIPLLPYDVVVQNDKSINRLKRALSNGQDYVLNKFVNLSYGENLLYYQKLDSLYTLLQESIDSVLKKFQKDAE